MYIIGENIHIISPRVKEALAEFNGPFFTDLARRLNGGLYIIARTRVHTVDVPFTHAVSVISKWGAGSSELLAGMKRAETSAAATHA
jgi:hypothetical protein